MNNLRTDPTDTICALATAGGIGAIGVIRVSGKRAIEIVASVFRGKDLTKQASHTAHFGRIADGDVTVDEVLATLFIAPASYTGENTVELGCHGSPFIQQQILQLLVKQGCRMAAPGEFTLRAFLNKKLDLSQAEAVADLIASQSPESHRTAMQQMRGGFSAEISKLREQLVNFASLIELELDFSEEDVEFAERTELRALVIKTQKLIHALIESFSYGNAVKNGIPTVIAGKPNAGKSTLLNALVNEERAIVSPVAGTTRDTIEETFVISGMLFRLTDTAGIRKEAGDEIEAIGIGRTMDKIRKASIVLYLFDVSNTSAGELKQELSALESADAIVIPVGNKTDLDEKRVELFREVFPEAIFISSRTGKGVDELKSRLSQVASSGKTGNDVVVTNARHFEALQHASSALQRVTEGMDQHQTSELLAADIRKALFHLGEITGEVTTDDLLENIFSKFCIGK